MSNRADEGAAAAAATAPAANGPPQSDGTAAPTARTGAKPAPPKPVVPCCVCGKLPAKRACPACKEHAAACVAAAFAHGADTPDSEGGREEQEDEDEVAVAAAAALRTELARTYMYCSKKCFMSTWPLHKPEPFHNKLPFRVAPAAEGAGLGCFAVRDIAKGECVLEEEPLFLVEDTGGESKLEWQVAGISKAAQLRFWALADSHSEQRQPPERPAAVATAADAAAPAHQHGGEPDGSVDVHRREKTAAGIVRTNAYPTAPGYGGMFATFARFNHSCTPNVTHRFERDGRRRVFAARALRRGEELLNSYIPTTQTRATRQAALREQFGFTCRCVACTDADGAVTGGGGSGGGERESGGSRGGSGEDVDGDDCSGAAEAAAAAGPAGGGGGGRGWWSPASDARRERLAHIDGEVAELVLAGSAAGAATAAARVKECLGLLRAERLDAPAMVARVAFDAQQACERGGDAAGAAEWRAVVRDNTALSARLE